MQFHFLASLPCSKQGLTGSVFQNIGSLALIFVFSIEALYQLFIPVIFMVALISIRFRCEAVYDADDSVN